MKWLAAVLALAGTALGVHGAWIPVKAVVAQVLLERAWDRAVAGEARPVPWPWADTWPVARLSAPRLGAERIVLAGASGAVLAFGPGHLDGTVRPGEDGSSVVAGHRDTHFAFLEHLAIGDELVVETAAGERRVYRVSEVRVVSEVDASVLAETPGPVLTLLTCYPFDAALPGGSLRFVVRAEPDPQQVTEGVPELAVAEAVAPLEEL